MPRYINSREDSNPGIDYVSSYDPARESQWLQLAQQRQQRYDAARQAMNEYSSQVSAAQLNDFDRPFIEKRLNTDIQDLNKMVNDTYGGDYGAALNKLSDEIVNRKRYYTPAIQRYQEHQKLEPVVRQLEAEGKLLWENGIDPRTQAVYDEQGNFTGIPDYKFRAKDDYGKKAEEMFNAALNTTNEKKVPSDIQGYIKIAKTRGWGALTPSQKKAILNDKDVERFVNETTFGIDPEMKGRNAFEYLEETLNSRFPTIQDNQYMYDQYAEDARRAATRVQPQGSGFMFPTVIDTDVDKGSAKELTSIAEKVKTLNPDLSGEPSLMKKTGEYFEDFWKTPTKQELADRDKPYVSDDMKKLKSKYKYMPGTTDKEKVANGLTFDMVKTTAQNNVRNLNFGDDGESARSKIIFGIGQNVGKKDVITEIKEDGRYGSKYDSEEALSILQGNKDKKLAPSTVSYHDKHGIILTSPEGKRYKLDSKALDSNLRPEIELLDNIRKEAFNYDDEGISKGSNKDLIKPIGKDAQGRQFYVRTVPNKFNPATNRQYPAKELIMVNGNSKQTIPLSDYEDIVTNNSTNTSQILNIITENTLQEVFPKMTFENPTPSKTISIK